MKFLRKIQSALRRNVAAPANTDSDCPRVVFVHIPKCAGISLVASLKAAMNQPASGSLDIPAAMESARAQRRFADWNDWMIHWSLFRQFQLHYYLGCKLPLVYGHMPLSCSTLDTFQSSYKFITMMRDPVERFISNYVYDRIGPHPIAAVQAAKDLPAELDRYLDSAEGAWLAREQTLMLGGVDFDSPCESSMIERAKHNLCRIHLIGFTDSMERFAAGVESILQRRFIVSRHNVTTVWADKMGVNQDDYMRCFTPQVRERLRELCAADYAVYDFARSIANK